MPKTSTSRAALSACTLALALSACGGGDAPSAVAQAAPPDNMARALAAGNGVSTSVATPQPTPPGEPLGEASVGRIGPAGGTLSTPDGELTLTVPPGAFDRDVDITVQRITNVAHGAKGGAWRIGPEGLNAALPMTLRLQLTDDDLAGTVPQTMSIATQDSAGYWQVHRRPQYDAQARTLTVQARRSSDWSKVTGVQLTPRQASALVGNAVDLVIVDCPAPAARRSDEWAPALPCVTEGAQMGTAQTWAVNGIPGGTPAVGTVAPSTGAVSAAASSTSGARYTAPAAVPPGRTVNVSVNYTPALPNAASHPLSARIEILPIESCAWLHGTPRLHYEAGLSYAHTASGPQGTLAMDQRGNIEGVMERVFDNDLYGVWSGVTTTGHVALSDSHSHGDEVDRLFGSGNPAIGTGLQENDYSGMQIVVDYRTCTYSLGVKMAVVAGNGEVNDVPRPTTVGGFMRGNAPIGGQMVLTERAAMPPRPQDDPAGTYFPGGLAGRLFDDGFAAPGHAGQAQVSWRVQAASR